VLKMKSCKICNKEKDNVQNVKGGNEWFCQECLDVGNDYIADLINSWNIMNNELLFSFMAVFGSIFAGLQIWQIKRISDLCERVAKIETEIEHHFDKRHA